MKKIPDRVLREAWLTGSEVRRKAFRRAFKGGTLDLKSRDFRAEWKANTDSVRDAMAATANVIAAYLKRHPEALLVLLVPSQLFTIFSTFSLAFPLA